MFKTNIPKKDFIISEGKPETSGIVNTARFGDIFLALERYYGFKDANNKIKQINIHEYGIDIYWHTEDTPKTKL